MARGLADKFDGVRLRQARAAAEEGRGISAAELARRIHATKAQVLAYENGLVRPDPRRIRVLAKALRIEPLQLSDSSSAQTWTLADVRRAHGLTAADASRALGLSLRAYRRLENEGIVPMHRFYLMSELAEVFGTSVSAIEEHLSRSPRLPQRLDEVREPLSCLLSFYLQPKNLDRPGPGDDEIIALAGLYRRSPLTVARIVGHEIARLRGMRRRQVGFEAVASFGATAEEQAKGQAAAQVEARKIGEVIDALPQNIDTFFRCMMPQDTWRILALFHALRPLGGWLSAEQLQATTQQLAVIPPQLLERRTVRKAAERAECRISEHGARHCTAYRPWYDACYPAVQAFVQVNERALAGHMQQSDLHDLLAQSEAVLLSFDGLLCRLFGRNLQTVSERFLAGAQSLQLAIPPQTPTDPVGMLRALVRHATPGQIRQLDRLLTQFETEAARHVAPLPGVSQLVRVLADSSRRLAVVTDHASDAVDTFLERLPTEIPPSRIAVFGRPDDPELMKPNPHGLARATAALKVPHSRVLLMGESIADALAAQTAGIPFVGIAATTRQAQMLRDAGASRTVASVRTITAVLKEQQAGA